MYYIGIYNATPGYAIQSSEVSEEEEGCLYSPCGVVHGNIASKATKVSALQPGI